MREKGREERKIEKEEKNCQGKGRGKIREKEERK